MVGHSEYDGSDLCILLRNNIEAVGGWVVQQPHIVIVCEGPQEEDIVCLAPLPRGEDARLGVLGRQLMTEPPTLPCFMRSPDNASSVALPPEVE